MIISNETEHLLLSPKESPANQRHSHGRTTKNNQKEVVLPSDGVQDKQSSLDSLELTSFNLIDFNSSLARITALCTAR